MFNGSYFVERGEILDVVRDAKIAGLAIVAGDKHSFWAGRVSKSLPPEPFEPLGVEFVTGSISAPGLFELAGLDGCRSTVPSRGSWSAT